MGSQLLPSLKNQHRFRAETDNQQACSETAVRQSAHAAGDGGRGEAPALPQVRRKAAWLRAASIFNRRHRWKGLHFSL